MSDEEDYYYDEGDCGGDDGEEEEEFYTEVTTEDMTAGSALQKKPEPMTRQDISDKMKADVNDVASFVCCPPEKTLLLLRHFGWNKEKTKEQYYDDMERVAKQAGIGLGDGDDGSLVFGSGEDEIECAACWDDVPPAQAARLGCKHWFCLSCWKNHLQFKLDNEGLKCVGARCLSSKSSIPGEKGGCTFQCSPKVFAQVLGGSSPDDPVLAKNANWQRYQRFLLDDFIVSQKENYVFCPSPHGCDYIVYHPRGKLLDSPMYVPEPPVTKAEPVETKKKESTSWFGSKKKEEKVKAPPKKEDEKKKEEPKPPQHQSLDTQVKCHCEYEFCYLCQTENHLPVTCQMLVKWLQKEKDDSETANYVVANCKNCPNPKCNKPTEKNGGCNWMKCHMCSYEWCWMCRKPHDHNLSTHKCVMEQSDKEKEADAEAAKSDLQRYVHFYERYRNHDHSKKLDSKVMSAVKKRIAADIQKTQCSLSDLDYLEETARVLLLCRHMLKYSYAYLYFLTPGTNPNAIFEFNQSQLEAATELLSQIVEDRSGKFSKAQVVNRTATAKQMLKNFSEIKY